MLVDEEAIFHAARALPPGEVQQAYVKQACGDNASLRRRVAALLLIYHASADASDTQAINLLDTDDRGVPRLPLPQIESYEVLEQIGEGGFAYVFRAQQTHPLRRQVAIKLLKPGMDTREVLARFAAERQALAAMNHPNIARVFDAGTTSEGRPYFVMELVEGRPVTEYCDRAKLTLRQRLELLIAVCRAVHHAHQRGVIHRDLKPANVLVPVHDGQAIPKVIDFGIAKAISQPLGEQSIHTRAMQLIGTPLYMSPEQAAAAGHDVDTRSDVYSLGVLLYELLTGTTPFDKEKLRSAGDLGMLRIIREDEPPAPSQKVSTLSGERVSTAAQQRGLDRRRLSQSLRGELDWIVLKTLEKDPDRRYDAASALAADLERYLNHEPVAASPPSSWYRAKKYVRRNVYRISLVGIIFFAVTSLVAGGVWHQWRLKTHVSNVKDEERKEARRYNREATLTSYAITMQIGEQLRQKGDLRRLAIVLNDWRPGVNEEDHRGFEWHLLWHSTAALREVRGMGTYVNVVDVSPDGKVFATGTDNGEMWFWDFDSLAKLDEWPWSAGSLESGRFSADGKYFLAACHGSTYAETWACRFPSKELAGQYKWHQFTTTSVILPEGLLVVGNIRPNGEGDLKTWNRLDNEAIFIWDRFGRRASDISSANPGRLLAVAHYRADGAHQPEAGQPGWAIDVIDRTSHRMFLEIPRRFDRPVRTAVSPGDGFLAFAEEGNPMEIWDLKTRQQHLVLKESHDFLGDLEFSADGSELAILGGERLVRDDTVSLWDVRTGTKKAERQIGQRGQSLAFAPDGKTVLIGAQHKVELWQPTPDPFEVTISLELPQEVWSVAFMPDDHSLVSAGDDHCLRIWDSGGNPQAYATAHDSLVSCLAVDPAGKVIATGSYDRNVRLWRRDDLMSIQTLKGHTDNVRCVAFSPDGSRLASGGRDQATKIWDLNSGEETAVLYNASNTVRGVSFWSNDKLITVSEDERVRVWDFRTQKWLRIIDTHSGAWSIAVSPDSRFFATGHKDGVVRFWDGESDEPFATLYGHSEGVLSVSFAPDGKTLATGSEDGTVRLWHVETHQELLRFEPQGGKVYAVSFSNDGQTLAAALGNGEIRLWRAPRSL